VLAVVSFLALAARGGTETEPAGATRADETVSPKDSIDYEGPETPKDTEWLLRSLNGHEAAKGSDILHFHDKQELGVEGGCMGFYIVHELEADRIRVVEPGLQVGRFERGKSEEAWRQAEAILGIMRDLAKVRATEDVFELRSEYGEVAAFVPLAPTRGDPTLAATEWIVTSLNGHEPLSRPPSTLEIEEEDLVGFGPRDGFGGAVDRMSDGEIEWSSQSNEGFSSTVLEPLAEDAALNRDGTPWKFRGCAESGEKTPVRGDAPITLTFDRGTLRTGGEGAMFGSAGCNDYRLTYEYPITRNGPDPLIVEGTSVSERKRAGPPGVFEQAQRFLGIVEDVAYYPDVRINGRMTLETEDDRQLVFAAPE
jgi:heat shock protein HslJ